MRKMQPKLIAFLQRHWNSDYGNIRLARRLKKDYKVLWRSVKRLEKKGYVFNPTLHGTVPIGTVRTYTQKDGSKSSFTKTADGWVYIQGSSEAGERVKKGRPKKKAKNGGTAKDIKKQKDGQEARSNARKSATKPNHHTPPTRREEHFTARPALITHKNPDEIQVKEHTGRLVEVKGYPVKTWKYL